MAKVAEAQNYPARHHRHPPMILVSIGVFVIGIGFSILLVVHELQALSQIRLRRPRPVSAPVGERPLAGLGRTTSGSSASCRSAATWCSAICSPCSWTSASARRTCCARSSSTLRHVADRHRSRLAVDARSQSRPRDGDPQLGMGELSLRAAGGCPDIAIYGLVVAGIWQGSGVTMAIMLAGLRGIDAEIWKAAQGRRHSEVAHLSLHRHADDARHGCHRIRPAMRRRRARLRSGRSR